MVGGQGAQDSTGRPSTVGGRVATGGGGGGGGGGGSDPYATTINRDMVLTTFIISTTPKSLLSLAEGINDTAVTKKFTKNLVKAGALLAPQVSVLFSISPTLSDFKC